ncbi:uncharacterized protein LOC144325490, partial [Podarcis muralis]
AGQALDSLPSTKLRTISLSPTSPPATSAPPGTRSLRGFSRERELESAACVEEQGPRFPEQPRRPARKSQRSSPAAPAPREGLLPAHPAAPAASPKKGAGASQHQARYCPGARPGPCASPLLLPPSGEGAATGFPSPRSPPLPASPAPSLRDACLPLPGSRPRCPAPSGSSPSKAAAAAASPPPRSQSGKKQQQQQRRKTERRGENAARSPLPQPVLPPALFALGRSVDCRPRPPFPSPARASRSAFLAPPPRLDGTCGASPQADIFGLRSLSTATFKVPALYPSALGGGGNSNLSSSAAKSAAAINPSLPDECCCRRRLNKASGPHLVSVR